MLLLKSCSVESALHTNNLPWVFVSQGFSQEKPQLYQTVHQNYQGKLILETWKPCKQSCTVFETILLYWIMNVKFGTRVHISHISFTEREQFIEYIFFIIALSFILIVNKSLYLMCKCLSHILNEEIQFWHYFIYYPVILWL